MPLLYISLITNPANYSLWNIQLYKVNTLVEYLDSYKPSLKANI
jgi:hypothetical protein